MNLTNNSKIEVAKKIIIKVFFLEKEHHFTSVIKQDKDNSFIESLDIEYVNEIKRRSIRISYTKNKIYEDIKYTFNQSIVRLPYSGVEDFFSLSVYLQSIKKDFSTSMINYFDEEKAELIVKRIADAMKENCLEIIVGDVWHETYYTRKD